MTRGLDGAAAQLPFQQLLHVARARAAYPPQTARRRRDAVRTHGDWVRGGRAGPGRGSAGGIGGGKRRGGTWPRERAGMGEGRVDGRWGRGRLVLPTTPRPWWLSSLRDRPGLSPDLTCDLPLTLCGPSWSGAHPLLQPPRPLRVMFYWGHY